MAKYITVFLKKGKKSVHVKELEKYRQKRYIFRITIQKFLAFLVYVLYHTNMIMLPLQGSRISSSVLTLGYSLCGVLSVSEYDHGVL